MCFYYFRKSLPSLSKSNTVEIESRYKAVFSKKDMPYNTALTGAEPQVEFELTNDTSYNAHGRAIGYVL